MTPRRRPTSHGGGNYGSERNSRRSTEANDLEHTNEGIYSKRRLTYHDAVIAIDQLLTITEACSNKKTPKGSAQQSGNFRLLANCR